MNNKLLAIGTIFLIILLVLSGLTIYNWQGDTQTKQGVLTDVTWSVPINLDDVTLILKFSDGEDVLVKEGNAEDSQEMYEYLTGWIGQEIIVEYSYAYDIMAYEIDSVSGVN